MIDQGMQSAVAKAFARMGSNRNPPFASREEYLADCLDIHRTYIDGQPPEEQVRLWIDLLEDPVAPLKNVVSPHVHGVFALASRAFADSPGASDQLVLPTSGAFSGDFASWQQEGVRAGTFISYEPPLDTIAVILRTPPPQSRLRTSTNASGALLNAEGIRADLIQRVLAQVDPQ
ncbi:hypothetical protein K2F54_18715 [Cryobacterium sp. 1639]|uniref:hypothetical protein n=1 Tax=Cryobacterium inferilacus TaxID=2866629 RepID=UPI001C729DC4|nr:hypothetical protein [Cryobacterium sp. 1639]MBX0301998.1 hypothetical protein [Cryobacterium sp. 1639]